MIRAHDIPRVLIERLEAAHPEAAYFGADELEVWPDDVVPQLLADGMLKPSGRTSSADCDGCDWNCQKSIVVRKRPDGQAIKAFILCDEEPNLGRIPVDSERLKQFSFTFGGLNNFLRAALASRLANFRSLPSPRLGVIKGRYGERYVALQFFDGVLNLLVGKQRDQINNLLKWNSGLSIDTAHLRRMANRKELAAASARGYQKNREKQKMRAQETRARDAKIVQIARTLLGQGRSRTDASKEIVKMDFVRKLHGPTMPISAERVRRILAEKLRT